MNQSERAAARLLVADFERWGRRAAEVRARRAAVRAAADSGERDLHARSVRIDRAGQAAWRVVPLEAGDLGIVRSLWERANLPEARADDPALLRLLTESAPRAVAEAGAVLGLRRMLGAAQTLRRTTLDETPVRIDIADRRPETTQLLCRLAEWDSCRATRGAAADLERAAELAPLRRAVDARTSHVLVIPASARPWRPWPSWLTCAAGARPTSWWCARPRS